MENILNSPKIRRRYLIANNGFIIYVHRTKNNLAIGLRDYQFYCFDARSRFLYLSEVLENHSIARISFLNLNWTFAQYKRIDYAEFLGLPNRPENFEKMVNIVTKLVEGVKFLRVDVCDSGGQVFFQN